MLIVLMILGVLALVTTSYLVWLHYNEDITGFCSEESRFDCMKVNQSKYASFWGIPVANLGLAFYIGFFLLSLGLYNGFDLRKIHRKIKRKHAYWLVFLIPFIGTLFSLRLTYYEAFVLKTWCPFCIIQQILIFIMLIVSYFLLKKRHLIQ